LLILKKNKTRNLKLMPFIRISDMECAFNREDKRLEDGRDGYIVGFLLQVVRSINGTRHI
jgi:hypothetical protein